MSEAYLKIEDLEVSYGAVEALRGVSLELCRGEIVALLGANGAGKSSLLKAVMQVVLAKRGRITFNGQNLNQFKTNDLVKNGLALVPEGRGILQTLSVRENLDLGAFHRRHYQSDLDQVLEVFPRVKERLQQLAGTLSGGEQQMLAIARALLAKPQLLLLDEPSLGLAPIIIQNIFQIIKGIQKAGVSILLIEQNAHMALKVADRAYCLETGRIVSQGTAKEMASNEAIKKAYLGG